MTDNPKPTLEEWWRENSYGFNQEEWGSMVKARSQGRVEDIVRIVGDHGQDDLLDEIIGELEFCDLGRGPYTREDAIKIRNGPRFVKWGGNKWVGVDE